MQDDSGIRRLLSQGGIYAAVQSLAGANRARRWLAAHHWRAEAGTKVIDVGCGPGDVLDFLPAGVHYVGFDISAAYVARAQTRYGSRGDFLVGTAADFLARPDPRLAEADLVLCNGLLHHLEDAEVLEVFALAARALTATGRMVCLEPTTLAHQQPLSRWMMSQDRGKNIRSEQEWKSLAARAFPSFETHILTGLYRIPYTHIVLECCMSPRLIASSAAPSTPA